MKDFLLYASVVILFLVCVLVVLIILMQRPSANAGMGSALGGVPPNPSSAGSRPMSSQS